MSILPKLVYKFNTIPIKKFQQVLWGQANSKFHMEKQTCKNSQENSEKRKGRGNKAYQILKHIPIIIKS